MKYLINDSFIFDTENRTLDLENNKSKVTLSKYATRTLYVLVENANSLVTRQKMFSNVWLEEASFASNASLNNYISEVRKAFANFEYNHEIIVTVPKVGFQFRGKAELLPFDPTPLHIEENTLPTNRKSYLNLIQTFVLNNKLKAFVVVTTLLLASAFILNLSNDKKITSTFLYSYKMCDIYSITWKNDMKDSVDFIKSIMVSESVECGISPRDIFFSEGRAYNNKYKVQMVTICDKTKSRSYTDCVNIRREIR